jgi:hypothetical protein
VEKNATPIKPAKHVKGAKVEKNIKHIGVDAKYNLTTLQPLKKVEPKTQPLKKVEPNILPRFCDTFSKSIFAILFSKVFLRYFFQKYFCDTFFKSIFAILFLKVFLRYFF